MSVVHSVHIYEDDAELVGRLCGIVYAALRGGDAVLIVASLAHRDRLVTELDKCGIDVRAKVRDGLFRMFDATEMLTLFMRNARPNKKLFKATVGALLNEARTFSRSKDRGLTVFGEMVSVLWDKKQTEAALELEQLWNEALAENTFHLHCAYPRSGFVNGDVAMLPKIQSCHSHVVQ